ncbi:GntR family transcriptional regulator [Caballeronia sp. INML1]|uniref:GntR family transcriptional regulator n=1 Tax=unclassified Caballeronia TaxID=2646786 RepID=UPI00390672A5
MAARFAPACRGGCRPVRGWRKPSFSERFACSRTPVREALRQLASEAPITLRPRQPAMRSRSRASSESRRSRGHVYLQSPLPVFLAGSIVA